MGETKKQAHRALYRKYRSKTLDEIKGQEHVTTTLKNAVKSGRISHAYLFTGPRGVGKTSIARILAHEINKLPYNDESTHLDIIEIDAASNRRIDDIRELREKVHIAPVSAKYKVYIIDEVHMLTTESFNALLKTLEEPPAHVIFILATTEVHKLPATIVSRTQRHTFRNIPTELAAKHLADIAKKEGIKITPEALKLLALHGGGSFRDSISMLDQLSQSSTEITAELVSSLLGIAPEEKINTLFQAHKAANNQAVLSTVEELLNFGATPSGIAEQLLKHLRDLTVRGEAVDIKLMEELLSVSSSTYPQLKLETALLSQQTLAVVSQPAIHPEKNTEPVEEMKSVGEKSHKVTKQEPEVKNEPTESQPETQKIETESNPAPPADDTPIQELDSQWTSILEAIKKRNNPLYTILRLASAQLRGNELILTLGFEFHQKRANDSKHKKIIQEAVTEILSITPVVTIELDKTLATTKPLPEVETTPEHSADASLISEIQDIMGGGEVVNV